MKHLKLFTSESDRAAFESSQLYEDPYTSAVYVNNEYTVYFGEPVAQQTPHETPSNRGGDR